MKMLRVPPMYKCIGLIDADLLDNGTRHPNLALLKIAGFLHDNGFMFELILNDQADISKYTEIFFSRVFTFTKLPAIYLNAIGTENESKFHIGGTGFYATETNVKEYLKKRTKDMSALENDELLEGISMAKQRPYYHLYDEFVSRQLAKGIKYSELKDYKEASIGFLTRGCVRHCPFCVNKLENKVVAYSKLEWFLDNERNENGKLVRPYICLWDDNFLAADRSVWYPLLQDLIKTKRPFQFRQGLDERMLVESPYGEEIAELLSKVKYHGDFIFAFDNWRDREVIEKALKVWRFYNPTRCTKFYLFCGFRQTKNDLDKFYRDIWEIFQRAKILMKYGCAGYLMRHEDYHNSPFENIYVQIARWCNQPQFFKKMSFWEYCYSNLTEESKLTKSGTFEDFENDLKAGVYEGVKLRKPVRTMLQMLEMFPNKHDELLEMFHYKMENLIDQTLWIPEGHGQA